jgi:uncharacterized membrane protein
VSHSTLRLEGNESKEIELQFRPGRGLEVGSFDTEVVAMVRDTEILAVPVTLQVLSPVDYARMALHRS